MNDRSLLRIAALGAVALVLAGCGEVRAADPPSAPAAAAAPPPAATAPAAEPTPPREAAPAPGARAGEGKPSPLHFEPTEKTRADFEISFPTDI
jgi:hypothetical protein